MRSALPVLFLLVLAIIGLGLNQPGRADCQGGPVFPQTIIAQDQSTIAWDTPASVDFVKGALSQVGEYETWVRGSVSAATFLDVSTDLPESGEGVFYLVKPSGPPCGSWQTGTGAEPGRDSDILVACSEITPTSDDIHDAIEAALIGLVNPAANPDEFMIMYDRIQDQLDCAIDIETEAPPATTLLPIGADPACCPECADTTYCESVSYCGPGNSYDWFSAAFPGSSFLQGLGPGPCLNEKCYLHDLCYRDNCVLADERCAFSPRSIAVGCEANWANDYAACLIEDAWSAKHLTINTLIYEWTFILQALPNPPCCDDLPCLADELGSDCSPGACNPLSGKCIPAILQDTTIWKDGTTVPCGNSTQSDDEFIRVATRDSADRFSRAAVQFDLDEHSSCSALEGSELWLYAAVQSEYKTNDFFVTALTTPWNGTTATCESAHGI